MLTRRSAARLLAATALASTVAGTAGAAGEKTIRIGLNFSLTGGDAESAQRMRDGALMAIDEANAKGLIKGYRLEAFVLDDATATAGQYDPAQAATNARKFVSDRSVVGAVGPQMSGAGKAMAPILSQGGLAIITPSSTNPDLTDPKFAAQYRPAGKAIYFRTVTTDAYQGPNMADFMAEKLGVKNDLHPGRPGRLRHRHGRRVPEAHRRQGRQRAGPRPAGPEGRRLLGDPDQDQVARCRQPVLRRRRHRRRQADQAELRDPAQHQEGRRGRDGRGRPAEGCRLPGLRGLVRHHRQPAHGRRPEDGQLDRRVQDEVQRGAGGLHHHRLRRRRHRHRRCQGRGRQRQAGDARGGARCDPGRQVQHAAGRDQLRRQRRHQGQGGQRLPASRRTTRRRSTT